MNSAKTPLLPGTSFPGFEVVPDAARAGLIFVHGIAEHGGRYRHVAAALAQSGISSFIYDQRGHGRSPGIRAHVGDFRAFAHDLQSVAAATRARFPGLPLFVWGHSMGSVVVTLAVALVPRLRINLRVDATRLTRVEEAQRAHMNDPLVPRTASLRLLHGFAEACQTCKSNLSRLDLPWLAIHGEADQVCPVSGSRRLIAAIAAADKQLVLYPGLLHEPHNEYEAARTAMFTLMSTWILTRV
jgi:alpha-beta hydrolase superfamily lysophospholipase